jgi:hypothetical protein
MKHVDSKVKKQAESCQRVEVTTFNSNLHYAHNENNIKQNHMSLNKLFSNLALTLFYILNG